MSGFLKNVERDILERRLMEHGEVVLVAVSGGVDSMVLLNSLVELAPQNGWNLVVGHFNHRLRGRSSDADERFVQAAAERLKLRCVSGKGEVRSLAKRDGISIEMAARRLRHEFLAKSAVRVGAKVIALGHHADDQVEWFFVKTLRGSGGSPVRWANPSSADAKISLVRPLLARTRKEISDYASEVGVKFREDASNASVEMLRNRVRHELVPLLERCYQPALRKVILRQLDICGAEADLARQLASGWRRNRRGRFDELPLAVQRRVLQAEVEGLGLPVTFDGVEALRSGPGRPVNLAAKQVMHDGEGVVTLAAEAPPSAAFGDETVLSLKLSGRLMRGEFSGMKWRSSVGKLPAGRALKFRTGLEFFDADRLGARVFLRRWLPGDRFQPIGMASAVKLQNLFTNLRVLRAERHQRVVALTESGEIWWVEGLRIGERFKVRPETQRVLRWAWSRK